MLKPCLVIGKLFDNIFSRFDTTLACDRQTDGRTTDINIAMCINEWMRTSERVIMKTMMMTLC